DSTTRFQILYITQHPDSSILRSLSTDIRLTEEELELLTDRMYSTVRNPMNPGVGIAAPQVGINRRIVWVQRYDKIGRPWEVFVNIRITNMSDTVKPRSDGCLSIPGVSGKSLRAIWCEVEYDLPDGTRVSERINHEYTAHIFQHEVDHLDGIIWTDRKPIQGMIIIDGDPDEYEGEIMPRID
ncbi:MAG: peptide deformylase, partial [Bacteroidales bacterium]|nr:peptide deformylase [Bacteroidales bacterium]